jgi:hypothetical protein
MLLFLVRGHEPSVPSRPTPDLAPSQPKVSEGSKPAVPDWALKRRGDPEAAGRATTPGSLRLRSRWRSWFDLNRIVLESREIPPYSVRNSLALGFLAHGWLATSDGSACSWSTAIDRGIASFLDKITLKDERKNEKPWLFEPLVHNLPRESARRRNFLFFSPRNLLKKLDSQK